MRRSASVPRRQARESRLARTSAAMPKPDLQVTTSQPKTAKPRAAFAWLTVVCRTLRGPWNLARSPSLSPPGYTRGMVGASNSVCRDCGLPACYRISSITSRGGLASTYHLCRTHAADTQPRPASSSGRPGIVDIPVTVRALAEAMGCKWSVILKALGRRGSLLQLNSILYEDATMSVASECKIALKVRVKLSAPDSAAP